MGLMFFISPKSCSFLPTCLLSALWMLNTTGWQGDDASNPQKFSKQSKTTPNRPWNLPMRADFLYLSSWGDGKNTRESLKNWNQFTAQWLLSWDPGPDRKAPSLRSQTASYPRRCDGRGKRWCPHVFCRRKSTARTWTLSRFLAKMSISFPTFSLFCLLLISP